MAKQLLEISNFSGGLNSYSDARDIKDEEFALNWNAVVDKAGVIRASGMATDSILTDYHDSSNFQKGYGLFQFKVDYPFSLIDGGFNTGIKAGTISATANSGQALCLLEASYTATADEFNNMTFFVYEGAGAGQTRKINDTASGTSAQLTLSSNLDTALGTTSKYIIYRWTPGLNWQGDVSGTATDDEDYITDGYSFYGTLGSEDEDTYHIYTKSAAVTSETSAFLGYIEYAPNLTLVPGVEYNLTFDCAAKEKWWGAMADGNQAYTDETIDSTEQGYGDQVPWVKLYSETVSDTSGCVNKLTYSGNNITTTTTHTIDVSGVGGFTAWTANKHWESVEQYSTDGKGRGLSLIINSAASTSDLTIRISENKGEGYKVGDTITFRDPDHATSSGTDITLTVASNGINRTGLSLYENNKWISATDQDAYIIDGYRNCVNDGDFKDGAMGATDDGVGTTTWNFYPSPYNISGQHFFARNPANKNLLTGEIGGASMLVYTGHSHVDNYIMTDEQYYIELDDLTPYHLNFRYDGGGGVAYAIKDITNDQWITNWTILSPTREEGNSLSDGDNADYLFQNWKYASHSSSLSGGDSSENSYYLKFTTPKNKSASSGTASGTNYDKIKVRLYFSAPVNNKWAYLYGVTIRKAHNDLVTLSHNSNSANPRNESITSWSTYSMKFRVPYGYSEASDWKLQLHAGQYGFLTMDSGESNLLGAMGNKQEVYFKNIRISAVKSNPDTLTILSNNSENYSDMSIYSSLHGTWMTNYIRWNDHSSRPVFDYVNGMLKISDANFSTSNNNKLMYYDSNSIEGTEVSRGWKVRDTYLSSPPSLEVAHAAADDVSTRQLNLIPYLNAYYEGLYWGKTDSIPYQGATNFTGHDTPGGWPLDCFGTTNDTTGGDPFVSGTGGNLKGKYNGLVSKYYACRAGSDTYDSSNNDGKGNPVQCFVTGDPDEDTWFLKPGMQLENGNYDKTERFFYNTETPFFQNNIDDGTGQAQGPYELRNVAFAGNLSNRGWSLNSQSVNGEDSNRVYVDSNSSGESDEGPRWPVQFVVQGDNEALSDLSPSGLMAGNTNSIHSVKFNFQYQISTAHFWNSLAFCPPVIIVKVGKLSNDNPSEATALLQDGIELTYSSDSSSIEKRICYVPDSTFGAHTMGHHGPLRLHEYSPNEIDESGSLVSISQDWKGTDSGHWGNPVLLTLNMVCDVDIPKGVLKKDDNILISIYDNFVEQNPSAIDGDAWKLFEGLSMYRYPGELGPNSDHTGYHTALDDISSVDNGGGSYYGKNWWAKYTRFKINNLDMTFYTDGEHSPDLDYSSSDCQTIFTFDSPDEVEASGWGARSFKVGLTSVNKFKEESYIKESDYEIGGANLEPVLVGSCPTAIIRLRDKVLKDPYTTKTKIYMRDSESDIFYLQLYVNHEDLKLYSTTSSKKVQGTYDSQNGVTTWIMERENMKSFNEVNSYESETMITQDDAKSQSNLTARYKTSVVANNRLYVGNIMQNGNIHGDRMLKSPIGKYNILPASSYIDVAINDGDEITALAYYKDKILQFKEKTVYVINVGGDYEFLEDTFNNVGVKQSCAVVNTPHGVAWVNRFGCYLYDGQKLTNLIDNIISPTSDYTSISNNYWTVSNDTSYIPAIGYMESTDTIIISTDVADSNEASFPRGFTYHFPTKSWVFLQRVWSGTTAQGQSGLSSNMITDENGDILYYRFKSGDTNATSCIKKWNNAPLATGNLKPFSFQTKDFTFGNIAVRKKIYKVYITYKASADTGLALTAAVDGTSSFSSTFSTSSKFKGTTTDCYGSSTLDSTGGGWKTAEMKFSTPSEVNNVYSLQLKLEGTITASASDLQINDMSISFRTKTVR